MLRQTKTLLTSIFLSFKFHLSLSCMGKRRCWCKISKEETLSDFVKGGFLQTDTLWLQSEISNVQSPSEVQM